jgi:hypothetical protein
MSTAELCVSFGHMKHTWLHIFEAASNYLRLYLRHPPVASTVVCGSSRKSFTCQVLPSKCWIALNAICLLLITHKKTSTGQKRKFNRQWKQDTVSMKDVYHTRSLTSSQSHTTAVVSWLNCWSMWILWKCLRCLRISDVRPKDHIHSWMIQFSTALSGPPHLPERKESRFWDFVMIKTSKIPLQNYWFLILTFQAKQEFSFWFILFPYYSRSSGKKWEERKIMEKKCDILQDRRNTNEVHELRPNLDQIPVAGTNPDWKQYSHTKLSAK